MKGTKGFRFFSTALSADEGVLRMFELIIRKKMLHSLLFYMHLKTTVCERHVCS